MTMEINNFQDILNAMERDPALAAALRRHILTDELLKVPARLVRIEEDIGILKEGQGRLETGVDTLKEGQARLEEGQERLEEIFRTNNLRLNQITGEMGNLRGNEYERRIRFRVLYRAGTEFGIETPDIALSQNDPRSPGFQQAIDRALSENRITQLELEELGDSDFIIMGGNDHHAVVEASITAANDDIMRARQRADILAKLTQGKAFAAIATTMIPQPQALLAHNQQVTVLHIAFP